MGTLEQMMRQIAMSERPPVSPLFQWGSSQAISAETHQNILGEKQCIHSFTTSHWPWGGSAVPGRNLSNLLLQALEDEAA